MIITAPVTDYIPASLLIGNGDRITRLTGVPDRIGAGAIGAVLISAGVGTNLIATSLIDALNTYYKGQGAGNYSIFEALALRDTGIHIDGAARNAGGDEVITGVGFQASVIIFIISDTTVGNMNWSIGFDDGSSHRCLALTNTGTFAVMMNTDSLYVKRDAANILQGEISAIGGDGFTITWTLTGNCATNYNYLALP